MILINNEFTFYKSFISKGLIIIYILYLRLLIKDLWKRYY